MLHLKLDTSSEKEVQYSQIIKTFFESAEEAYEMKFYRAAIVYYEKALKVCKKLDADFFDIYTCYNSMGECYLELAKKNPEQLDNAAACFEQAVRYVPNVPETIALQRLDFQQRLMCLTELHEDLVSIYSQQNKYEECKFHARKAVLYTLQCYSNDKNRIANSFENLAVCCEKLKDYSNAVKYLEKAIQYYKKAHLFNLSFISRKREIVENLRRKIPVVHAQPIQSHFELPTTVTSVATSSDYEYGASNLYPEIKKSENLTILSIFNSFSHGSQVKDLLSVETTNKDTAKLRA